MRSLFMMVICGVVALPAYAQINIANCLIKAYPDSINAVQDDTIIFKNGKTLPIGKVANTPFTERLKRASVADQLSQTYPLDFKIPQQYQDAGRLRNDEFFINMYGGTSSAVSSQLVKVYWQPAKKNLQFTKVNGAANQLKKVGDEIAQNPVLSRYVAISLGTFNFRKIAGTNRLSTHSFGIAVDFRLPKHLHKYWRWDGCKSENQACPFPQAILQDQNLNQVVQIFEKHGFIWGGKWASYDTPHFEYRPELLIKECRS
ncbi:MAG: M15 family metallopeptidase [Moraxella sp.]|nr:M15 family metallopeptidase [Moraxella sp.]